MHTFIYYHFKRGAKIREFTNNYYLFLGLAKEMFLVLDQPIQVRPQNLGD